MVLITGGAFQGKLDRARELAAREDREPVIVSEEYARAEDIIRADIWDQFHAWVKRRMEEGVDAQTEAELAEILAANPRLIIVTREMGCGLVPVDAFERAWRERVGRLGCFLAERAERVYLVTCGVPLCIREEETPC
ncbi:MAG: bifunctional adenosylcobinamide kinase/adenosylcobinamide-phosphate guanylyltransferase [Lachnospiraceae bacterium]|nr:bifunctional adenosylcobinamide kinase/adenosylcobinamide-phosphate guanylyltransferase [Lachnospiraceae bacterium]